MTNDDFAAGLRAVAAWFETHPEIPAPSGLRIPVYGMDDTKESVAIQIRALGNAKKEYDNDFFRLTREFGPIEVSIVSYRTAVCTARVVGRKTVAAVPAVPEHDVDIVEWDCEPILDQSEGEQS